MIKNISIKGHISFKLLIFLFVLLLFFSVSISSFNCSKDNPVDSQESYLNISDIHIGLYMDLGIWDVCRESTEQMLIELGCNYTKINKDSILYGNLNRFNMLFIPAGNPGTYVEYLNPEASNKIRNFVRQGGGYIGICGSAYFAVERALWRGWSSEPRKFDQINCLGIFPGTADGPIEDFAPTYKDSNCKILFTDKNHPVTSNLPDTLQCAYDHGPAYLSVGNNVSVLGRTVNGNNPVVVSCQYYSGKVFLTTNHPEWDSTRTSWGLVKNAILWCSNK